MWARQGKAFVWIDHADGEVELVGEQLAFLQDVMPGVGIALVRMPMLDLQEGDIVHGVLSVDEDEEGDLGEGPWIS